MLARLARLAGFGHKQSFVKWDQVKSHDNLLACFQFSSPARNGRGICSWWRDYGVYKRPDYLPGRYHKRQWCADR